MRDLAKRDEPTEQLPADKSALIPFASRLMSLPSEISEAPGLRTHSALLQTLADLA